MIKENEFKEWLENNTELSRASLTDVVSRIKRADKILPVQNDPIYMYYLSEKEEYKSLSCTVRSQIKRAVTLYMKSLEGV